MKIVSAALAILFLATAARADTVDITVTNCLCGLPSTTPINLEAQLTVEQVTGTFFFAGQAFLFTGTVDEVTALTGTLNGYPMTLDPAPFGEGSWIQTASGSPGYNGDSAYVLGTIYFSADGIDSWLMNDVTNYLEGFSVSGPVYYSADSVSAPEPATYAMLIAGIVSLLALFRLAQKPQV